MEKLDKLISLINEIEETNPKKPEMVKMAKDIKKMVTSMENVFARVQSSVKDFLKSGWEK